MLELINWARNITYSATHQNAQQVAGDPGFVAVRDLQMQQFNTFIDAQNIPADEAVIFGGDMNVDKHANFLNEYNNMFTIFNSTEPTYIGHPNTWDKYANHYVDLGSVEPEYLDYVLADNDYLVPDEQSNEVWILRSNHDDMWNIHDLSDHFGVLGRFEYTYPIDPCDTTIISINSTAVDESYAGANDGSIDITVGGGLTPYTFSWSNGSSSEDISGLAPGSYTVDVTDANGCMETGNASVGTSSNCNAAVDNFGTNPLSHSGNGSSTTTLNLPSGSFDASFDISEIGQKTNGKANRRYIEFVTVTYLDGNGNSQSYDTYSGASVASANVSISGGVQSITIELEDIYDGSTSSTMSVLMTAVNYCSSTPACPDADADGVCDVDDVCPGFDDGLIGTGCNDGVDCTENDVYTTSCNCAGTYTDSDGDGVCDADDICPGGDDTIDTDGDGTPDFCDNGNCTTVTNSFAVNPLTHSGSGSNSTTLNLPAGNSDAEFTVSNIGSRLNGKGSRKYIESVTITYVDGAGNTQNYGTFDGSGAVNVSISGSVQSITVSLADAYDGNSSTTLSVDLSDVSSCGSGSARVVSKAEFLDGIEIYPNPAMNTLNITNAFVKEISMTLSIFSIGGQAIRSVAVNASNNIQLDVSELTKGVYLLQIVSEEGAIQTLKFIKQ